MKGKLVAIICIFIVIVGSLFVYANEGLSETVMMDRNHENNIFINGYEWDTSNTYMYQDRTYVSIRAFVEYFGKGVFRRDTSNEYIIRDILDGEPYDTWDGGSKSENDESYSVIMERTVNTFLYNWWALSYNAQYLYEGDVYVPLRDLATLLGKSVTWKPEYNAISVNDRPDKNLEGIVYGDEEEMRNREYREVSLAKLLANPKEFDGKKIRLEGVLLVEFESDELFLTREDMKYLNTKNSVSLNFRTHNLLGVPIEELENITQQYVVVLGTFKYYDDHDDRLLTEIKYLRTLTAFWD